jgi:hypothetical protein
VVVVEIAATCYSTRVGRRLYLLIRREYAIDYRIAVERQVLNSCRSLRPGSVHLEWRGNVLVRGT